MALREKLDALVSGNVVEVTVYECPSCGDRVRRVEGYCPDCGEEIEEERTYVPVMAETGW
jgi:hypothetical protein